MNSNTTCAFERIKGRRLQSMNVVQLNGDVNLISLAKDSKYDIPDSDAKSAESHSINVNPMPRLPRVIARIQT